MKRTGYGTKFKKYLRMLAVILPLLAILTLNTPALAAPIINLSASIGAVGTTVTITGTNFESYRGDNIFLYFDNEEFSGSPLKVPESGTFSLDFDIPGDAKAGRHVIRVKSEIDTTLASSLFVIPETEIKLDKVEGTVGTTVTIEGKGFYANRMLVIYYYQRIGQKLSTEIVSATGEFSHLLIVPESTAGTHRILVENAEGNSSEAEFRVIPSLKLNITSGAPGDILTVSGTGFGFRNDISIFFGSDEVAYAKTSDYGNFEVTFNVPEMKSGKYDVKIVDEDDNTDWAKFTVMAGASLSQATGSVGTELTVRGTGFMPTETVTIKYGNLEIVTATTDNDGAFTSAFYVPTSTSGQHVITVSDGTTTKLLSFTVESTRPPTPTILLPANMSETRPTAYLDWQDVTDPSMPVTYSLQLASDPNFSNIVLKKEGLTDSDYTLNEEEKLAAVKQETPYYWRVKAIDSASNESEWSTPWSFYVAAPSVPALSPPETDSKAEPLAHFDWNDASSLSPPIAYNLQIASDPNFSSIILEKKGIAESEYAISEEEELPAVKKEAPYYWRVKAIDNEGNESEWSTAQSFYVGFSFTLPSWTLYTLIGLGVLVIGFFAFWVGRRTAYYQGEI